MPVQPFFDFPWFSDNPPPSGSKLLISNQPWNRTRLRYTRRFVHDQSFDPAFLKNQIPEIRAPDIELIHDTFHDLRCRRGSLYQGFVNNEFLNFQITRVLHCRQHGHEQGAEISRPSVNGRICSYMIGNDREKSSDTFRLKFSHMQGQITECRKKIRAQDVPPDEFRQFLVQYGLDHHLTEEMIEYLGMCESTIVRPVVLLEKCHDRCTILQNPEDFPICILGQHEIDEPRNQDLVDGLRLVVSQMASDFLEKVPEKVPTFLIIHHLFDRIAELAHFTFDHPFGQEGERPAGGSFPNGRNNIGVGDLHQEKWPQRIGIRFEELANGFDITRRPSFFFNPFFCNTWFGRLQGKGIDEITLSQCRDVPFDALMPDECLPSRQYEGSLASNLFDQVAHLAPCKIVPVWISKLIETVDGQGHKSMTNKHRDLIERNGKAQGLQAERDQILEKGKHTSSTLDMKEEGTSPGHESVRAGMGKGLDEFGLADTGRAVDQHDVDGSQIAALPQGQKIVEADDVHERIIGRIIDFRKQSLDRNTVLDVLRVFPEEFFLLIGPSSKVAEFVRSQERSI